MGWLFSAVVSTAVSALLLALVYGYLYYIERERSMGIWALSWVLYTMRFVCMLLILLWGESALLLIGNQLFSLASGLFLLWGSYVWVHQTMPRWWTIATFLCGGWVIVTALAETSFLWLTLPPFVFIGFIFIWTGAVIKQNSGVSGLSKNLIVWAFILWGFHKMNFPFLRPVLWFAPWGYILAAVLSLLVALGIILLYFERTKNALRESEARYRALIEASPTSIMAIKNGSYIFTNPAGVKMLGYNTANEILNVPVLDTIAPVSQALVLERMKRLAAAQENLPVEIELLRPDGSTLWVESTSVPIQYEGEPAILVISQDVTARKQAEETMQQTQARLQSIMDNAPAYIYIVDLNHRYILINRMYEKLFDITSREIAGKSFDQFFPSENVAQAIAQNEQVITTKQPLTIEETVPIPGNQLRTALTIKFPVFERPGELSAVGGITLDITELKQTTAKLEASLQEKEVLLKEIHHRVKNNMQVISSLLDLQSEFIDDPRVVQMLKDSRQRIHSMALVHEKLYRSQDLACIDFGDYVEELVEDLFTAYHHLAARVSPLIEVGNTFLTVEIAIPCGMIISELVSNALKYAFPQETEQENVLQVTFETNSTSHRLQVSDNGVGLPPKIKVEESGTLGLQLVHILTRQLHGDLEIHNINGTTFKITFPKNNAAKETA